MADLATGSNLSKFMAGLSQVGDSQRIADDCTSNKIIQFRMKILFQKRKCQNFNSNNQKFESIELELTLIYYLNLLKIFAF